MYMLLLILLSQVIFIFLLFQLHLPRPQSLAITFWGIFELIIKESGDEGSDGKGRKSLFFSFPSLPRSRFTLIPIIPLLHLSLALAVQLSLGKPVEDAATSLALVIILPPPPPSKKKREKQKLLEIKN